MKFWHSLAPFTLGLVPLPGAHRVADGAVADEGGHRGRPRHASRLPGFTDGSTLPRAAAHPQLPGAHSSQCPRPAKRQRRPGAHVEAPERNATGGHTAKIARTNVCTLQRSVAPFAQNWGIAGEGSTEPVREMTSDNVPAHRMLLTSYA